MARMIDASHFGEIMEQWKKDCLECDDQHGADVIADVILQLDDMPTLTQPNEPMTCEGCIYEHNEHENCNYCKRAPYLGDYYYRRPPEGEEDT